MRKFIISAATALSLLGISATAAAAETGGIGVVNFATCITDSKAGKKEQENLESMRKYITNLMEDTDKELREMAAQFEDPEYLDSLSPKAEEELKAKFQSRQEDLSRYQNQFYQMMNQAQMQMIQKMSGTIAKAAEKIAGEKQLDYVMNKEACFYIRPDLDLTENVIGEMDKTFEIEAQAQKMTDSSEDLKINAIEENTLNQAG